MTWTVAKPVGRQQEREVEDFRREVHSRWKMFNTFTWDPPNVPAASTVDTTLTSATLEVLRGTRPGMSVTVSPPSTIEAGIVVGGAWVAADDSLTIRLGNVTALAVNPASGTWSFHGVVI